MLEIITSPNPLLLQKSQDCSVDDKDLKDLSKQMISLMYKYSGIGLAAPQVGVLKKIIVVDCDYDPENIKETKNPMVLINPVIVDKSEEKEEYSEGCLSCPGVSVPVERYSEVKVKYFDLNWKEHYIDATDLLSHCLQHEIDHLEGKTIFQTCLVQYRIQLLRDYEEALARGAVPGEVSSRESYLNEK